MKAAKLPFDPRWSLVFTPHSSNPEPDLIKKARSSLWWDDSPALRRPQEIRAGARRARELGVTGYVPSLEAFTFVATEAEEGQAWLKGQAAGAAGIRLAGARRAALRRVADAGQPGRLPGVQPQPRPPFEAYKEILGRDVFGAASTPQAVEDVLELQAAFNFRADVVPAVAADEPRAGPGDGGSGRPDAREAGRVPGRPGSAAGHRGAAPGAEVGRRGGTAPDRPVGARPLGGRGRGVARSRPLKSLRRLVPRPARHHQRSHAMSLIDHPTGGYRFLPGIAPYSCGVVSAPGHEIAHVTLERPVPYERGFDLIRARLGDEGRPVAALCGVELRSPRPFSFEGFAEFNAGYARILEGWGAVRRGRQPRGPDQRRPRGRPARASRPSTASPMRGHATRRCRRRSSSPGPANCPRASWRPGGIVRAGRDARRRRSPRRRAFVMDLMEARLRGLGVGWDRVTAVDLYTVHPVADLLPEVILGRIGAAAVHGVRWSYSRPPIEGIEFEMDVRGVRAELRLG